MFKRPSVFQKLRTPALPLSVRMLEPVFLFSLVDTDKLIPSSGGLFISEKKILPWLGSSGAQSIISIR